ncbi:MAG: tRNA (N(6)-L-threonylcarbamoyladenosine(37)-C(2))-methylthiotransferase MtaB [Deltaproteobacteria bacterium]|uniref:tRNA (N(6)-L-threonylcarbamoyladenosine(37)-C(2))-methylthiotransferase n=1 Tax=Candidatus Zymogenus saltonus TaxID=2844893 RepID=A0A9D8PN89_9DELT|nr:tRNA (N(6)-L-threonylcarbamoyladenosine(37)-C(2))-methylthiotransferase MtaB [Candidatus Zymogenus saltonus]
MKKSVKDRVSIVTLGCKVNYTESVEISDKLIERGYRVYHGLNPSDLVIVNGCTVTSKADYQSRQAIRRANREIPGTPVMVIGCGAAVHPEKMEAAGEVASAHPVRDVDSICDTVSSLIGSPAKSDSGPEFKGRTRAFLKIQDGCDSFCTYCIVPYARGRERSVDTGEVIDRIERFVDKGYKEIVLVGINLGRYGAGLNGGKRGGGGRVNLAFLLESIVRKDLPIRIRLSSIEPVDLTTDLVSVISESKKVAPHLHVPLQSGDNSILKAMGRPYTPDHFIERVNEAVSAFSESRGGIAPSLGVDVMVGFPGEGEEQFENTIKTLREIPATYLHVFPYSLRPKTPASKMRGQVRGDIKRERVRRLKGLDAEMRSRYMGSAVGKMLTVLGERCLDGLLTGKSENYLKVSFRGKPEETNRFFDVKIESVSRDGLYGERA